MLDNKGAFLDKIQAMRVFIRVKETESFTRAAESMGLPKATVSLAIQQLENEIGVRLFHRTTRRVQLSRDGQIYFERCKDLLADLEGLEQMFRSSKERLTGRIRFDMPTGFARHLVMRAIPEFSARHPDLELEISSTDRYVDMVREGFDCVLRVGDLAPSGMIARRVGLMRLVNCASPAYLAKRGCPQTVTELEGHLLVNYSQHFSGRAATFDYLQDGQEQSLVLQASVTVNNADIYQQACLAGLGIIQAPWVGVREAVESGRLQVILPELTLQALPITILYPHRRNLPARMIVFMDWLEERVKEHIAER
jgi:DNA-binding transcriptional LysR family regulator